ncbi:ABC transporter permease [Microbacterium sp. SORGH_AS_0888]|uniref:ABC transporter permease n=1 Tax=Microbacterium sp. SORGH_AS_0888 TaxID=3041791 RepID=UPI0027864A84|nr:ABC transporter permease [Microbacterium sp. SORGH_AS_0888]MDQ1130435.1 ABC-type dipeptide/oligopeptide/nickel transport system permease component [Microbacterium sp. SORGH_AS_0888]
MSIADAAVHAWRSQLWWLRRLVMIPVYLFLFCVVLFFLVRAIPGDPVTNATGGQNITQEQYARMQEAMGLGGSLWDQLLAYLGRLVTGDLGTSFSTGALVSDDLARVIPGTVQNALLAAVGIVLLGVAAGTIVLWRPSSVAGRVVTFVARAAGAVPDFVLGIFGILVFFVILRVAPAPIGLFDVVLLPPPTITGFSLIDSALAGRWDVWLSIVNHLWLPTLTLVLAYGPMLLKVLLPGLTESAEAAPTKFAVATGQHPAAVIWSVWRRAAPAALAMFGTLFGFLLGGAVIIEQLFALQGSAQYAVNAVKRSDYAALQGILLAIALISLLVFLAVDIVTGILDPRRRTVVTN